MLRTLLLTTALAVAPFAAAPALAQDMAAHNAMHAQHHPGRIMLAATGEARVAPDVAILSGGVTTQAETAAEAMRLNTATMTAVRAALRASGVAAADVQTAQLTVTPVYTYDEMSTATVSGYQAMNIVNARVTELDSLGSVVEAMFGAGLNELQGVNFSIENRDAALRQARVDAVRLLEASAAAYSDALGVQIGELIDFNEQVGESEEDRLARATYGDISAVVSSGTVVVSVTVTATYAIAE